MPFLHKRVIAPAWRQANKRCRGASLVSPTPLDMTAASHGAQPRGVTEYTQTVGMVLITDTHTHTLGEVVPHAAPHRQLSAKMDSPPCKFTNAFELAQTHTPRSPKNVVVGRCGVLLPGARLNGVFGTGALNLSSASMVAAARGVRDPLAKMPLPLPAMPTAVRVALPVAPTVVRIFAAGVVAPREGPGVFSSGASCSRIIRARCRVRALCSSAARRSLSRSTSRLVASSCSLNDASSALCASAAASSPALRAASFAFSR